MYAIKCYRRSLLISLILKAHIYKRKKKVELEPIKLEFYKAKKKRVELEPIKLEFYKVSFKNSR